MGEKPGKPGKPGKLGKPGKPEKPEKPGKPGKEKGPMVCLTKDEVSSLCTGNTTLSQKLESAMEACKEGTVRAKGKENHLNLVLNQMNYSQCFQINLKDQFAF